MNFKSLKFFLLFFLSLCIDCCVYACCIPVGKWGHIDEDAKRRLCCCLSASKSVKGLLTEEPIKSSRNVAALAAKTAPIFFVNLFDPLPLHRLTSQQIASIGSIFDFSSIIMEGSSSSNRFFLLTYIEKEQAVEARRLFLSTNAITNVEEIIKSFAALPNCQQLFVSVLKDVLFEKKQLDSLMAAKISERSEFRAIEGMLLGKSKSYGKELFGDNYDVCKDRTFAELIISDNPEVKKASIYLFAKYSASLYMQPKLADDRFAIAEKIILRAQLHDVPLSASVITFKKQLTSLSKNQYS